MNTWLPGDEADVAVFHAIEENRDGSGTLERLHSRHRYAEGIYG